VFADHIQSLFCFVNSETWMWVECGSLPCKAKNCTKLFL